MERVLLNEKLFAIGLVWAMPVKKFLSSRKNLRDHADAVRVGFGEDAPDMRAMARHRLPKVRRRVWQTFTGQEGFGDFADDWRPWAAARSVAACLDAPQSFLGLFPLELAASKDGEGRPAWWLHCRMNGVIPEQGDQVFFTREEAEEALTFFQHLTGISPEDCMRPETVSDSMDWLAERCRLSSADVWARDKGRLLNLNRSLSRTGALRLAVGLGLAAILAGGAFAAHYHVKRAEYEAARQAQIARAQRQKDLKENPHKFFGMDWQKAPLATDVARQCLPSLMELPLSSQGWSLANAECSGPRIALDWRHEEGGDFISLPDNGQLDAKNSKLAHSSRTVPALDRLTPRPDGPGTDHEMLVDMQTATGLLSQIAQDTGTRLDLKFAAQERKTIDKVGVMSPWHVGTWKLSAVPDLLMGVGDKDGLFELLAEVPGLTVTGIDLVGGDDGGWAVRGKIYANH